MRGIAARSSSPPLSRNRAASRAPVLSSLIAFSHSRAAASASSAVPAALARRPELPVQLVLRRGDPPGIRGRLRPVEPLAEHVVRPLGLAQRLGGRLRVVAGGRSRARSARPRAGVASRTDRRSTASGAGSAPPVGVARVALARWHSAASGSAAATATAPTASDGPRLLPGWRGRTTRPWTGAPTSSDEGSGSAGTGPGRPPRTRDPLVRAERRDRVEDGNGSSTPPARRRAAARPTRPGSRAPGRLRARDGPTTGTGSPAPAHPDRPGRRPRARPARRRLVCGHRDRCRWNTCSNRGLRRRPAGRGSATAPDAQRATSHARRPRRRPRASPGSGRGRRRRDPRASRRRRACTEFWEIVTRTWRFGAGRARTASMMAAPTAVPMTMPTARNAISDGLTNLPCGPAAGPARRPPA